MRLTSFFLLRLVNFILIGALAYTIGALVAEWMHREILSFPIPKFKSLNVQPVNIVSQGGRLQEEFQGILDRNVFSAQKTEITLPLPDTVIESENCQDTANENCQISLSGADNEGIVKVLSKYLEKKSINISIDATLEGADLEGYDTLNFNNDGFSCWK